MPNYILYIAHSDHNTINECRFSLLKLLSVYNLHPPAHIAVAVYTDQPQLFENFIPFFKTFELLTLTPDKLKSWQGNTGYSQRIKLAALLDFALTHAGNMVLFQTHTYLAQTIDSIWNDLSNNVIYLHAEEALKQTRSRLPGKTVLPENDVTLYGEKQFTYTTNLFTWNTSVIGINALQTPVLKEALLLADTLYRKYKHPQTEQIACSYCFTQSHTVKPLNDKVVQYESLYDFSLLLNYFFKQNEEESIPNLVKKAHYIDARKILADKTEFQNLPLYKKGWQALMGKGWSIKNYFKKL